MGISSHRKYNRCKAMSQNQKQSGTCPINYQISGFLKLFPRSNRIGDRWSSGRKKWQSLPCIVDFHSAQSKRAWTCSIHCPWGTPRQDCSLPLSVVLSTWLSQKALITLSAEKLSLSISLASHSFIILRVKPFFYLKLSTVQNCKY